MRITKIHPVFAVTDDLVVGSLPGYVKIKVGYEAFWAVIIEDEVLEGHIVCRIDNELLRTEEHGLEYEMLIAFESHHLDSESSIRAMKTSRLFMQMDDNIHIDMEENTITFAGPNVDQPH